MIGRYVRATCGANVLHGWITTHFGGRQLLQIDGAGSTLLLRPHWTVEPFERPARPEEAARAHGDELDRQAAAQMNAANRAEHDAWGATLQVLPSRVQHIQVIRACGCSKVEACQVCRGGDR